MYSGAKRTTEVYSDRTRAGCRVRCRVPGASCLVRCEVPGAGTKHRTRHGLPCYSGFFAMISFSRISKQYGRQVLFVDASFQLNPGDKVGLVGPNGSGKTTLFRMIVGEEAAGRGRRVGAEAAVDRLLPAGRRRDARPVGRRRSDRRQRAAGRSAPRAGVASARDGRSGQGPTRWTPSSRGSARCRRSTSTSAATRSRARRARSCTGSGSKTTGSTATWATSPAAGRCASRWPARCSASPTSC